MNAQPVPDTVLDPLQVGAASRDLEHIDPLFWTVTPEDAINLGYAWYVQHSEPTGSPMQDHAAKSVAEREAFFEHFAHVPRARAYFTEIREAALTYARGLLNAHHHYSLQLEEARQRKHQRRRDNVLTATRTGFIRGGVKLLTTSMTALFASMAVLNKFLVEHSAPIGWTALAVAGGVLLMTIYFETGKIARQGREIYQRFDRDVLAARKRRAENFKTELEVAFDMIERAYERILGRSAPSSSAARYHLFALTERHLNEDEGIYAEEVLENRIGWLKLFGRGRRIFEAMLKAAREDRNAVPRS